MTTPNGTELWEVRRDRKGDAPSVKDIQDGANWNPISRDLTQTWAGLCFFSAYDENQRHTEFAGSPTGPKRGPHLVKDIRRRYQWFPLPRIFTNVAGPLLLLRPMTKPTATSCGKVRRDRSGDPPSSRIIQDGAIWILSCYLTNVGGTFVLLSAPYDEQPTASVVVRSPDGNRRGDHPRQGYRTGIFWFATHA